MTRTRAFSAVELLTTMAVGSMFVAMLIPSVQGAKEAALNATCADRLRNLAVSVNTFMIDNSMCPQQARDFGTNAADKKTYTQHLGFKNWHYAMVESISGDLPYVKDNPGAGEVQWDRSYFQRKSPDNPQSVKTRALQTGIMDCPVTDPAETTGMSFGPVDLLNDKNVALGDELYKLKPTASRSDAVLAGDTNGVGIGYRYGTGEYGDPIFRHNATIEPSEGVEHGTGELNGTFERGDGTANIAFFDGSVLPFAPADWDSAVLNGDIDLRALKNN